MPTDFNLAKAIRTKIDAENLTASLAAMQIGVSPVAVANVMGKGSKPNSRTAAKFAKWLGVDEALITGGAKPAKEAKVPKAKAEKPTKIAKVAKVAKPTKVAKGKSATVRDVDEVLSIVREAIEAGSAAEADPMLDDDLARRVHEASAKIRNAIETMLDVMPG